jgi:hypothetical protein
MKAIIFATLLVAVFTQTTTTDDQLEKVCPNADWSRFPTAEEKKAIEDCGNGCGPIVECHASDCSTVEQDL